jgi:hypothetical protein
MDEQGYTITVTIDADPDAVLDAVCDVRGWWSEDIEGGTREVGDEFRYRFEEVHSARTRVTGTPRWCSPPGPRSRTSGG